MAYKKLVRIDDLHRADYISKFSNVISKVMHFHLIQVSVHYENR